MNTTVEFIKEYIKKQYDLDFKLDYIRTHKYLIYKNKKEEYNIMCDYAFHDVGGKRQQVWSIYIDYMNYKEWYGNGRAIIDNGISTIDSIMQEWGFKRQQEQLNLFKEDK